VLIVTVAPSELTCLFRLPVLLAKALNLNLAVVTPAVCSFLAGTLNDVGPLNHSNPSN